MTHNKCKCGIPLPFDEEQCYSCFIAGLPTAKTYAKFVKGFKWMIMQLEFGRLTKHERRKKHYEKSKQHNPELMKTWAKKNSELRIN